MQNENEDTMFGCLYSYLNGTRQKEGQIQLRNKLITYMAGLFFTVKAPIDHIDQSYLDTLQLREDCYTRGCIKIWTYYLSCKDRSVPSQAKYFYITSKDRMKFEAVNFLCSHYNNYGYILDKYTIGHLFGDVFKVLVFINGVCIQEAARPTFRDKSKTLNYSESVYLQYNSGTFTLLNNNNQKKNIEKPKWKTPTVQYTQEVTSVGKYALMDLKLKTYLGTGFVPPSRKNDQNIEIHTCRITDKIDLRDEQDRYAIVPINDSNSHKETVYIYVFRRDYLGHLFDITDDCTKKTVESVLLIIINNIPVETTDELVLTVTDSNVNVETVRKYVKRK